MLKLIKLSVIYAFLRRLYVFIFIILFAELMLLHLILKPHTSITAYLRSAPRTAFMAFLLTLFCWIIIKVIYATMLVKLNSYMYISRFTRRIYMNTKYFNKSSVLIDDFMDGLLSTPKKYMNKDFQTNTHEYICMSLLRLLRQKGITASIVYRYMEKHNNSFKVLEKCVITLENDVKYEISFQFKKKVFLLEKVLHYNSLLKYLKDVKKVEHKVNRYKVIIPGDLLLALTASN